MPITEFWDSHKWNTALPKGQGHYCLCEHQESVSVKELGVTDPEVKESSVGIHSGRQNMYLFVSDSPRLFLISLKFYFCRLEKFVSSSEMLM